MKIRSENNLNEILFYAYVMFTGSFTFSTAERRIADRSDGNPRVRHKQTLYKQLYLLFVKKQVLASEKYKSNNTRKQLNESVRPRRVSLRETNKPKHIWPDFFPLGFLFASWEQH